MTADVPSPLLAAAIEAAMAKSAGDIAVLDLREMAAFTNYFLVCTGWSKPQIQAIADEIDRRMTPQGLGHAQREGYDKAEWVLLDYGEFVAHIFSDKARLYFDLERLWRAAPRIEVPEAGADQIVAG
ncbi:MAG TPA: ribosome silencing factor [Patescibacteria group bacterium]|nr:ribosome silencing factor [Patescibacteria group bacterium]